MSTNDTTNVLQIPIVGNQVPTNTTPEEHIQSQGDPSRAIGGIGFEQLGLFRTPEQRVLVTSSENAYEEGYDADGQIGPFFDQVEGADMIEMEDESALPDGNGVRVAGEGEHHLLYQPMGSL